jgi:hypothetical protein
MDEFDQRIVTLLDELVPELETEIDVDELRALSRPRHATARRRVRKAAERRLGTPRSQARNRLAIAGAAIAAAAVALGSYLVTMSADPDAHTSTVVPPASTEPSDLTGSIWRLTTVASQGENAEPASAPVTYTFADGGSTDHVGDAAPTNIAPGRITFGNWANDLLGHNGPRLDPAQSNQVFTIMSGTLSWSIAGDTLTLDNPSAGTLTFDRASVELPVLPTNGTTADPLMPDPREDIALAEERAEPVPTLNYEPTEQVRSKFWSFLKLLDGGESILVRYEVGDACDHLLGFRVQEGSNAVELTSFIQHDAGTCSQPLIFAYGIVPLSQPLGDRALLHAPLG